MNIIIISIPNLHNKNDYDFEWLEKISKVSNYLGISKILNAANWFNNVYITK